MIYPKANGNAESIDGNGISINVKREKSEKKSHDADVKVEALFESLGGQGKLRIKRYNPETSKNDYMGQIDVDDALIENLFETVAKLFGGGEYELQGYHKGHYLATAHIEISRDVFPPKSKKAEQQAQAQQQAQQQGPDLLQLLAYSQQQAQQQQAQMQQMQSQMQAQQTQMFALLMQTQENASARLAGVMTAALGQRPEAPAGQLESGISTVTNVARLLESLGYSKPGESASDERGMGERILTPMLTTVAGKIGDVVAGQLKDAATPKVIQVPAPPVVSLPPRMEPLAAAGFAAQTTPAGRVSSPAANVGPVTRVGEALPVVPPGVMKKPPGAVALTKEQVEARIAARRGIPAAPIASAASAEK